MHIYTFHNTMSKKQYYIAKKNDTENMLNFMKKMPYSMKKMSAGGNKIRYKVIHNNGSNGTREYSNQCMWLSILDYVNRVLNKNWSLEEIRNIASRYGPINGKLEEYDYDTMRDSLEGLLRQYRLRVRIYYAICEGEEHNLIDDELYIDIGSEIPRNIIYIVSYGAHFELITEINGNNLMGENFNNAQASEFVPNENLALGNLANEINVRNADKRTEINKKLVSRLNYYIRLYKLHIFILMQNNAKSLAEINNMEEILRMYNNDLQENPSLTNNPDFKNDIDRCNERISTLNNIIKNQELEIEKYKDLILQKKIKIEKMIQLINK